MDRDIEKEFERTNHKVDVVKTELEADLKTVHRYQYQLEERVRSLETRQTMSEGNINSLLEDMRSIKKDTRWILRLIVGGIVTGLLALLVQTGGSGP